MSDLRMKNFSDTYDLIDAKGSKLISLGPQISILKKALEKKKESRKAVKKSTKRKLANMFKS